MIFLNKNNNSNSSTILNLFIKNIIYFILSQVTYFDL